MKAGLASIAALACAAICACASAAEKAVFPETLPAGIAKGSEQGEYVSSRDGAVMVFVPEGEVEIGSDSSDEDEAPRHKVKISAFFVDRFEVTNARYAAFLEWWTKAAPAQRRAYSHKDEPPEYDHTPAFWPKEAPKDASGSGTGGESRPAEPSRNAPVPDEPVTGVSWYSAYAFACWAGKSLPTEAQWEKASGYDLKTRTCFKYPWGIQKPDFTLLNFQGNVRKPTRVGTYKTGVSQSGCHDMAGNVWEWCLDFYHKEFYKSKAGSVDDPVNDFPSPFRVSRGGSYNSDETEVRCSYRDRSKPEDRFADLGFRCVKAAAERTEPDGGAGR